MRSLQECNYRCRSRQHALELIRAITKCEDTQLLIGFIRSCYSHLSAKDEYGRSILHVGHFF